MRILNQHVDQFKFFTKLFENEKNKNWKWLDIGACRGDIINMLLNFTNQNGQAFDPNPMNAQFLTYQYGTNPRVQFHHKAVGNKNEKVKFFFKRSNTPEEEYDNHYTGSTRVEDFEKDSVYEYEIDCVTLDEHYKNGNFPDFVKLDVEGSEWDVLEGATSLLERDTIWQIEFHKSEDWHKRKILYDYGYEIYDLSFNKLPQECELIYQTIIKKPTTQF